MILACECQTLADLFRLTVNVLFEERRKKSFMADNTEISLQLWLSSLLPNVCTPKTMIHFCKEF